MSHVRSPFKLRVPKASELALRGDGGGRGGEWAGTGGGRGWGERRAGEGWQSLMRQIASSRRRKPFAGCDMLTFVTYQQLQLHRRRSHCNSRGFKLLLLSLQAAGHQHNSPSPWLGAAKSCVQPSPSFPPPSPLPRLPAFPNYAAGH